MLTQIALQSADSTSYQITTRVLLYGRIYVRYIKITINVRFTKYVVFNARLKMHYVSTYQWIKVSSFCSPKH